MKSINLIPAARREAKRRRRQRNACVVACCAYGVMLGAALGVAHFVLAGDGGESLAARLTKADAEIDRYQQQAASARVELAAQKSTLEANRTVAEQPDWSILLALLARTTGEDVVLRSVVVAPPVNAPAPASTANGKPAAPPATPATPATPDVVLELTGAGQSQLAVSQHVLRLEQTGLFSKVTLLDTGREAYVNGNVIAFRLQCQFGEPRHLAVTATDAGRINP